MLRTEPTALPPTPRRSRHNSYHTRNRHYSVPRASVARATLIPRVAGPKLRVLLYLCERDSIHAHLCHHP